MPATEIIITRVPIPPDLDPEPVLQALHTFEPLITANPFLARYERRPVPLEDLVDDPFFRVDGQKLQAFIVHDRVPIIPGAGSWASKDVSIPCVFQSFERGVRCRAEAQAGVTVRSSYEVRRRGEVQAGGATTTGSPPRDETPDHYGETPGFELVEIARVECGTLVRAFVRRSFASAHQEILQRVVDSIRRVHSEKQHDRL